MIYGVQINMDKRPKTAIDEPPTQKPEDQAHIFYTKISMDPSGKQQL